MLRIIKKTLQIGVITEKISSLIRAPATTLISNNDDELEKIGIQMKTEINRCFAGSLAIRQVDAGSCNGCELEIHALNNPYYAIERFGIHFVASPRHADLLLVTGPVSRHMQTALLRTYETTPHPKLVIAVGTCANNGGEFGTSYASCGAVSNIIPVNAVIEGCPPTPLELMLGILTLIHQK